MNHYYRFLKQLTIGSIALNLSACSFFGPSTFPSDNPQYNYESLPRANPYASSPQDSYTAQDYLQMAETAVTPQKELYQLSAADKLLQENNLSAAAKLLKQINPLSLDSDLRTYQQTLQGKLALLQNDPHQAIRLLSAQQSLIHSQAPHVQIEYYQSLARAYDEVDNIEASVQQRVALSKLLSDTAARKQNDLDIWQSLQTLPLSTLEEGVLSSDRITQGWYELAAIANQNQSNGQHLLDKLLAWQRTYSDHPANQLFSNELSSQTLLNQPQRIVLMLPLNGELANSADAIRNGFLGAYYAAKKQGIAPTVTVEDISQQPILTAYQKAVEQGADFVVGPLTKDNVSTLLNNADLSVPVLTLNEVNDLASPTYAFQFGLSPQDEAVQTANRAWLNGQRRALIIAPKNDWGQGIAQAFSTRWQELGGEVVDQMAFSPQENLGPAIAQLLRVQELPKGVKGLPERRHDVDMVFLVAEAAVARQVKPLLKFYNAGSLPVYANSMVYGGRANPAADKDLDGIIFSDTPWVLEADSTIRSQRAQATALWAAATGRYARLYAMGMDAYRLSTQMNRLLLMPEFGISGATGLLTLDGMHHVQRRLVWAQFQQGIPRILSPGAQ